VVTKEDYGMWKLNPVTQQFMREIKTLVEDGIAELGSGQHTEDMGRTYLCIGKINALNSILKLDFVEESNVRDE
jgi:hypothetical protein